MEALLLNAAHMEEMRDRNTDVTDAEWIAQLLEHGMLSPSFVRRLFRDRTPQTRPSVAPIQFRWVRDRVGLAAATREYLTEHWRRAPASTSRRATSSSRRQDRRRVHLVRHRSASRPAHFHSRRPGSKTSGTARSSATLSTGSRRSCAGGLAPARKRHVGEAQAAPKRLNETSPIVLRPVTTPLTGTLWEPRQERDLCRQQV
jgi:hypothetical protein